MGSYSTQKYATESVTFPKSATSAPGQRSYATFAELPASSSTTGNTAFVVATNKLYMWNGVGWYLIATVTNSQPSSITSVDATYSLAADGTVTTITAVATDPEGFPLTWSYAVSAGSLTAVPAALAVGVAASGASAYTLSGGATGDNANVAIKVGQTVNFTVNASGHPFYIRDSNGGSNVSSPAATGQGAVSGVVSWTPNTTGTYYYQCGNHNAMVGTITVTAAGVTATVAQADNVFTITPSTVEANAGTFSLTFNVTDGVNASVSKVSAFTLAFSLPTIANTVRFAAIPSPAPFNDASNDNGAVACSESYWARVQVRNINTKSQYLDVYNVSDNSLKFSVNLNIPNSYYNYTTLDICDNYVIVGEMSNTNGGGTSPPSYGQRGWVGKYSITDGSLTVAKTWTAVKGSSSERGFFGCQIKINTDETKVYVTAPRANFGTSAVGSVYILDSSLATVTEIANPNSGSYFGDRPTDSSGSIDCTATYWAIGHAQAVGSNRGNVKIYDNSNNTVFRTLGHPDGTGNGYNYGYSVEMDGDYIAIGSPNGDAAQYGQSTGIVYIYKISTGVMMTQIRVPGGYPVYMFGAQLAMNESTLCVGGNYGAAGEQYTAYDISAIATGDGSLNSGITLTGQGDTSLNNRIGGPMVANRSVANIVMGSSNDPFPGANPGNVALLANYGRGYVTILE